MGKPSAPTSLAVVVVGPTELRLAWVDASTNETSFMVQRAIGDGAFVAEATLPPQRTQYAALELTPGTRYRFRVKAHNSSGDSLYSNVAEGTTAGSVPAPSKPPLAAVLTER